MKKNIQDCKFTSIVGFRGDSLVCPQAFGGDIYGGCSTGCVFCLSGDTPIALVDGSKKPIKELKIGVGILTYNESTKTIEPNKIKQVMKRRSKIKILVIGNKTIRITENHKVYTRRGWVEVKDLDKDDKVLIDL